MKKIISFGVAGLLMLTCFSGCGKEEMNSVEQSREVAFSLAETDVSGFNATQVRFTDSGSVLFNGADIIALDYSGIVKSQTQISGGLGEGEYYACFDVDPNGDYRALRATSDLADLSVDRFNGEGAVIESVKIESEIFEGDETFPQRLLIANDYFYIQTVFEVYVFDSDGRFVMKTPDGNGGQSEYIKSIFRLKDGRAAALSVGLDYSDGSWFAVISMINADLKETEDFTIPIAGSGGDCVFAKGGELDVLMCTTMGIYDYSLTDGDRKGIFNLLDYGINVGDLEDLTLLTDGGLLLAMRGGIGGVITEMIRCTPDEDGVAPNRKIITLSAFDIDYWLQGYITSFNKNNPDYRIEVWSYKESNEDEALRKFNLDLMAGKIADIIVLDRFVPSQSYINKGLFADIYGIMNADTSFNKSDYLPNALSSLEREGKLYEIFPMFMIDTVAAKSSEVGENAGWSLDEFAAYIDTKPNSSYIIDSFSRLDFIRVMIQLSFIDPITGECSFDIESFYKILEISERFPEAGLSENADYGEFMLGLADGDPIMYNTRPMRFRSIRIDEMSYFGEPLTFKGFPEAQGNGSYFMPSAKFAVAEKSDNKDGAWEFIKYMLENYSDIYEIYLPIKLSVLEELKLKAMENPSYPDGNGGNIEMDYTVYTSDGGKVLIGNNTQAQSDKMMNLILSLKYVRPRNDTVSNIIIEEVEAYLSGGKSVGDVAGVIENRVNLYVSEAG
ncbi:MAG: extracellular solute-binding protein [Oscillospiraceae bacterium]|nr:extracellular solute-binding protein [Oscillospiraceae bacterium]